jgi:ubiquinone/menaquinone biosynthesis C-methylase UbiE
VIRLYERTVVPALGGALSRREAYDYLVTSIEGFADPGRVRAAMGSAGLTAVRTSGLHLGSVCVHMGIKP